MRIGFALPQFGPLAHHPDQIAHFAEEVENFGGDSLWVGDRLLTAVDPTVGYGGGTTIPSRFRAALDPFTVLTIAATATERVALGTNVLNAPWYQPAVLARSLTSIDLLSGGRLVPGLGIGWSPDEYRAAGIAWKQRGARLDECLDALEALWTTNPAEYQGKYCAVPRAHVELRPAQLPRPPIYLAGFAPVAMARVANRADGWLPVCRPGAGVFDPGAHIAKPLGRIRRLAQAAGRDPGAIDAILRVNPTQSATVDEIANALVRAEQEAGVDNAFVDLMYVADSTDQAIELAERILVQAQSR